MRKLIMILLIMLVGVLTSCSSTGEVVYDEPSDNFINLLNKPKYDSDIMYYLNIQKTLTVKSYINYNGYFSYFNEEALLFNGITDNIYIEYLRYEVREVFLENVLYDDLNSFSQLIFDSYYPEEQYYSVIDTISLIENILDKVVDYKEYVRYDRIEYNVYVTKEQLVSDDKLVSLLEVMYGEDLIDSISSSDEICFKFFSDLDYSYFYSWMYLNINGSNYIKTLV